MQAKGDVFQNKQQWPSKRPENRQSAFNEPPLLFGKTTSQGEGKRLPKPSKQAYVGPRTAETAVVS